MNQIWKVSDVTVADVADYMRLTEVTASDQNYINSLIEIAKTYIMKETGVDAEGMDASSDFVIVLFVLCQDMYDNRALYVDKSNLNHVVESILGLHAVNLL
ncbi:MAG: phage gp6-like head-tail connector protein [Anaerolineaceae bacterium]|nr:phage gp6-like head-tail connector protein [Anaerolineaceae bacterium]